MKSTNNMRKHLQFLSTTAKYTSITKIYVFVQKSSKIKLELFCKTVRLMGLYCLYRNGGKEKQMHSNIKNKTF